MPKVFVLNGPNLNLLGKREPEIYGSTTLDDIIKNLKFKAQNVNIMLESFQSNCEGELINKTAELINHDYNFLIINPAALTHTSIAWRDTLAAIKIPFIEVHLSNIYSREEFRKKSYFSDIALGIISGFGESSYTLALDYAIKYINGKE
jgi:3-dehydroquinate dehydratase II